MKFSSALFYLSMVGLVGLSGCASYRAAPLHPLNKGRLAPAQHADDAASQTVSFEYKVLSTNESKLYLDRNVIKKGYQPIHISIQNNSNHHLHFSPNNLTLPLVPAYQVAQTVHTSTVKRVVGYGIAGLFIWPFLVPAVVDGFKSEKANEQLDIDFEQKELKAQAIPAYSSINGLLFVPRHSFDADFSLTLTDQTTNKPVILSTRKVQVAVS